MGIIIKNSVWEHVAGDVTLVRTSDSSMVICGLPDDIDKVTETLKTSYNKSKEGKVHVNEFYDAIIKELPLCKGNISITQSRNNEAGKVWMWYGEGGHGEGGDFKILELMSFLKGYTARTDGYFVNDDLADAVEKFFIEYF